MVYQSIIVDFKHILFPIFHIESVLGSSSCSEVYVVRSEGLSVRSPGTCTQHSNQNNQHTSRNHRGSSGSQSRDRH